LLETLKGYVEKILEIGNSFLRNPFREPGGGLVYQEFKRWMKGFLGVKRPPPLSLSKEAL
jgi:hypothetical protein